MSSDPRTSSPALIAPRETLALLGARLRGAKAYDRIAGYFCPSILEAAGEALETPRDG